MTKGSYTVRFDVDRFLGHYNKFVSSPTNQDRGLKLLHYTLWLLSVFWRKREDALKKLSGEILMGRYLLRLYGLPSAIEGARTGSWGGKSVWSQRLGKIMAWSMIVFYPMEHLAYIGWKSPKLCPPATVRASQLSAFSCRAWTAYLLAEIAQSLLGLRELQQMKQRLLPNGKDTEVSA